MRPFKSDVLRPNAFDCFGGAKPMHSPSHFSRFPVADLFRACASQLIVLHHLAFYGPMSDFAYDLAPALIGWLSSEARQVVQVFLVMGGFFAARALAPDGFLIVRQPPTALARRYMRLVLPFGAAMLLAVLGAALARSLMVHDSIPEVAGGLQFAAHVLLLHGVLDQEALSAGAWYVAIDFQLFAMLLGLLWLGQRLRGEARAARWPVALLIAASLFYFNLDDDWDIYGLYFFGAYGLGAVAWWAVSRERANLRFLVLALLTGVALALDFRSRIALALATAFVLVFAARVKVWPRWLDNDFVVYGGRISFAIFLVHFPVCLVVNGLFVRFLPHQVAVQAVGMLCAWGLSLACGILFHRYVEVPLQTWASRLSSNRRVGVTTLSR